MAPWIQQLTDPWERYIAPLKISVESPAGIKGIKPIFMTWLILLFLKTTYVDSEDLILTNARRFYSAGGTF